MTPCDTTKIGKSHPSCQLKKIHESAQNHPIYIGSYTFQKSTPIIQSDIKESQRYVQDGKLLNVQTHTGSRMKLQHSNRAHTNSRDDARMSLANVTQCSLVPSFRALSIHNPQPPTLKQSTLLTTDTKLHQPIWLCSFLASKTGKRKGGKRAVWQCEQSDKGLGKRRGQCVDR